MLDSARRKEYVLRIDPTMDTGTVARLERELADMRKLAEEALGAAEALYLFWEDGFGTAEAAREAYFGAVQKYEDMGGWFAYQPSQNHQPTQP